MKSNRLKTLSSRLTLSHLLVSLVSIILITLYAAQTIFNAAREKVEHNYEDLAFALSNALEEPLIGSASSGESSDSLEEIVSAVMPVNPDFDYTIYLPDGTPLVSSNESLPPPANPETDPEIWEAMGSIIGEGETIRPNAQGVEMIYLAVRVEHLGETYGILRLEIPLAPAMGAARNSLGIFLTVALFVALAMSGVGYMLARRLAKPIENLTRTAEALAEGDLSARAVSPSEPHELSRLVEAFNVMAGRLESHVIQLRSFVANASHELRTPLTSIKLRVEALRHGALDDPGVTDRFLGEVEGEVDRLSGMVNNLLDLSRIEAGLFTDERTMVDMVLVVNEICETFHTRASRAGVALVCNVDSDLPPIEGDENQLGRMVSNLVDNAIKYTSKGGRVGIDLHKEQGMLKLQVKDTGYGIAASHLPHIFERFYRVEATRPRYGPPQGSGLGLPIAKSIVEAHGGKIGVSSQVGRGTTFWVELPIM